METINQVEQQNFLSLEWREDHLRILDQTFLPTRTVYSDLRDVGRIWDAIKKLKVRGAPAIGIAAAYGFYLGLKDIQDTNFTSFWIEVERIAEYLNNARPTAVNLSWALNRVKNSIFAIKEKPIDEIKQHVLEVAKTIHQEDRRVCKQIGENGNSLVSKKSNILTHCNTGGLAASEFGTALSVIYHAHQSNKKIHVWVDETRPLLQGSRLTAWELSTAEIPMTLITDSMAGFVMQQGKVDCVIVGTDRVAKNGDMANKIGTYSLAVLAKQHNIPFYVAAPLSSIDLSLEKGGDIPIEERDRTEITKFSGNKTAPDKINIYNPAFDITPANLITAYITEKGIIKPDFETHISKLFS